MESCHSVEYHARSSGPYLIYGKTPVDEGPKQSFLTLCSTFPSLYLSISLSSLSLWLGAWDNCPTLDGFDPSVSSFWDYLWCERTARTKTGSGSYAESAKHDARRHASPHPTKYSCITQMTFLVITMKTYTEKINFINFGCFEKERLG